jgi:anhydro-N-acetylmuramic acid kinase
MKVIGLMSGTSADGIDAAAVEIGDERPRPRVTLIAHEQRAYPAPLRAAILAAAEGESLTAADIARLRVRIGEEHADAALACANRAGLAVEDVDAVATHGQTVAHLPGERPRATLQLVDAARIAEALRAPVVADFRSADIAAGGEGAPLVPFGDWVVFTDGKRARAILNVGGIANVTVLPANASRDDVIAFDTGPGNMVIDAVTSRLTDRRQAFDAQGALAAGGTVDASLLERALSHEYFARVPPKSTGRETFGADFAADMLESGRGLEPADLVATVTALTARSIADALRRFVAVRVDEVIVAGGGARNRTLLRMLGDALDGVPLRGSDELGVPPEAREALAFAILGAMALRGEPNTLPRCTGARRAVVGGAVYRP